MKNTIARAVRGTATVLLAGTILVAVAGTSASAAEKNPGGKGGDTKKAESTKGSHAAKGTKGSKGSQGTTAAHGANGDCGQYCSTSDGSPSKNGNGGGDATGRPCAGCVGNADDKNPPGQYPNGSDHNNGYECDGNSGIGRGNPAHSGCTTAPAPVVTPEKPAPVTVVPPAPVTPEVPAVPAAPAEVLGTRFERPGMAPVVEAAPAPAQVLGVRVERPVRAGSSLPMTGGETVELLLGGLVLLVGGTAATITGSRRRRTTA